MDFITIELILWIVVDIFLFAYFFMFLIKGLKDEGKSGNYFICVSILFLFIGIQRFLSIIFDFFYSETIILFFINLCLIVGAIPLLFHLESNIIKTKRILTCIALIMVIIYAIAYLVFNIDRVMMYYFFVPPFIVALGSVGSIYIYLIVKASGNVRQNAILIVIGMVIFILFWFIHSQLGRASPNPDPNIVDIIGIVSPIGYLVGLFVLAFGFFKKRE